MTRASFWVSSGAAIIALAATGCSSKVPSEENTDGVTELTWSGHAGLHDALLSKVGRGLAIALADPEMRAWLRSRIDASPYVEWRIPFKDVLLHEPNLPEIRRVSELARLTPAEQVRQKSLPSLELYFPVEKHRDGWTAIDPVQVAVRIAHGETYRLYTTDGTASVIRGNHVPAIATLVLASSEIDYADRPSAIRGGSRTGTGMLAQLQARHSASRVGDMALPPPLEPPPPPPPTGGANSSRHTRLAYFKTTKYHDDWLGGRDEVEIFGSLLGFNECTWRTEVSPHKDYYMDVASSFSTIATAIPWGTARVSIDAFEDDDGRCLRRLSDDRYGSTFLSIDQYGPIFGTSNPGHIAVRVEASVP